MNQTKRILFVVLLFSLPLLGAKKQVTKYEGGFYLGEVSFPSGQTCIAMRFYARDNFFSGLERIEQAGVVHFRKKSQLVTTFPETVTLKVTAERGYCPTAPRGAKSQSVSQPQTVIPGGLAPEDLKFQIEWIGINGRVVEILSTKVFKESWQELRDRWEYTLLLKTKDALLTEKLSVKVVAIGGKEHGRVTRQH